MNDQIGRQAKRIRTLNDEFRGTFVGGTVLVTAGFQALPETVRRDVLSSIRSFQDFDQDNDPHGEHDFVCVELDGQKFFAKIDYYDPSMQAGSENPADPEKTRRVMTVMLAHEY